jgi:fructose-1,6-bisphosphatase/sedoheptulose 1,7-bisphosphatase-like protein
MSISGFNKMLALQAAFVTESAAIESYHWVGRGNENLLTRQQLMLCVMN